MNVNLKTAGDKSSPLLETANRTTPGSCFGVTQLILEELIYDACTFIEPNLQTRLLESTKLRPVTVTAVPPVKMPLLGVTSQEVAQICKLQAIRDHAASTYRMTKITRPIGDGGAIHAP